MVVNQPHPANHKSVTEIVGFNGGVTLSLFRLNSFDSSSFDSDSVDRIHPLEITMQNELGTRSTSYALYFFGEVRQSHKLVLFYGYYLRLKFVSVLFPIRAYTADGMHSTQKYGYVQLCIHQYARSEN